MVRRRLLFWLIKAYIQKWGKSIAVFFVLGLIIFFGLLQFIQYIIPKIPIGQKETIGLVGAYQIDTLPPIVVQDITYGLTKIDADGKPVPGIAEKWEILNDGKTYKFHIKDNLKFSDNSKVESTLINYAFSGVTISRPDTKTLVFNLKDSYSPFLLTASRPVFIKNYIGIGEYKIKDVELNGNFVETITLANVKDPYKVKIYHFFPSAEALKTAFVLGEINKAIGIVDPGYNNTSFSEYPGVEVTKKTNFSTLVTLFYNTEDPLLSDKKVRNALSYALPDDFSQGERNYSPYPPSSWAYTQAYDRYQDPERAQTLISEATSGSDSGKLAITIDTLPKYKQTAEEIKNQWEPLGIQTTIREVQNVPDRFQIFLGNFNVPKDPDQYTLWHSNEPNNITKYKNLRIDKYLEDGRKITNMNERTSLYTDFQKYLLDDNPASFLYFPYEYEVTRT